MDLFVVCASLFGVFGSWLHTQSLFVVSCRDLCV